MINVDGVRCIGCAMCKADCPTANISIQDQKSVHGKWCLECGHCLAICPQNAVVFSGVYHPAEILQDDDSRPFDIQPDELLNFVKFRRSTRQFTDEPVSDADIANIVEMGRYTQTGANAQALRYVVLTKETLAAITPVALDALATLDVKKVDKKAMRLPQTYLDFQAIWIHWQSVYQKKQKDLLFHGAPHALLIIGNTGNELDGCFNAGHLELMINALGLGACLMGFGTFAFAVSPELRRTIGLADDESVICMMVFGHPAVRYLRTVNRKPARCEII